MSGTVPQGSSAVPPADTAGPDFGGNAGKRTENTYFTRGLTHGEARRIIGWLRHGH